MEWKQMARRAVAAVIVCSLCAAAAIPGASASSANDLREQANQIQQQIDKNNKELQKLKDKKADQAEYAAKLSAQVETIQGSLKVVQARVDELNANINGLNTQIAQVQREIDAQQKEISETYQKLQKRIRSMYMSSDNASTLGILLGSTDYATFLMSAELISRTSRYDSNMIQTFKQQIDKQEKNKQSLDEKKAALEKDKTEQESALDTLSKQSIDAQTKAEEAAGILKGLDQSSQAVKNLIAKQEREQAAVEAQIDAIINGASKGEEGAVTPSNTRLQWPLPGRPYGNGSYISSPFGYRIHPITGQRKLHKGVDLSGGGIQNAPIAAAESGTVLTAAYNSTTGYGNYVIIDHGNGLVTLYGHCQTLRVSRGQKVKRGQTVATVGSTGQSTGPHLHFEVRVNGEYQNPMPYIT